MTAAHSSQMAIPWDVTSGKHGGHKNSRTANDKVAPHKESIRERIRVFVVACGHKGTTLAEIASCFGKQLHQVSGRLTELKISGHLFQSGRDAQGFTIYVGRKDWVNGSLERGEDRK